MVLVLLCRLLVLFYRVLGILRGRGMVYIRLLHRTDRWGLTARGRRKSIPPRYYI